MECSRCGKPLVHGVVIVTDDGHGAMVGRECLNQLGGKRAPMTIQTLIFPKSKFTKESAIAWARSHRMKASKVDETEHSFRIRQLSPRKYSGGTFRQFPLGVSGVTAVGVRPNHAGDGHWFLVDMVTRTVRRASEHQSDAPPRFVKVYARDATDAYGRARAMQKHHGANLASKASALFLVMTIENEEETLRYQGHSAHRADAEAIEWSARGYEAVVSKLVGKTDKIVAKYAPYEGRNPAIVQAHRERFGGQ